jgi:hypothetical protein
MMKSSTNGAPPPPHPPPPMCNGRRRRTGHVTAPYVCGLTRLKPLHTQVTAMVLGDRRDASVL